MTNAIPKYNFNLTESTHIPHKDLVMLAHDIRSPFSKILNLLDILSSSNDASQINNLCKKYIPLISDTANNVDNMLREMLRSHINNLREYRNTLEARDLIHNCLSFIEDCESVTFKHSHQSGCFINVNEVKMLRVISNIVKNALEASENKSNIWFTSRLISENKEVEIIIGNSNSTIPSKDLNKVFESTYSKNKKNGNGLGLLIVKEFIESQGGRIFCRSTKNTVEFIINLPFSTKRH